MNNSAVWDLYMKNYDSLLLSLHAYRELLGDLYLHALMQVRKMKKKDINILEAGCGTGNILHFLERLRNDIPGKEINLTGIDRSDSALKTASGKMQEGCRFFQCNLGKIGLGMEDTDYKKFARTSFNLILINNVLFSLSDREKTIFLNEISRILSKDGVLIVSEPHDKAALFNLLRYELFYSGKSGIFRLLIRKKLLRSLLLMVAINLGPFSRYRLSSPGELKGFLALSGFFPIVFQWEAYGGNNVIHVYKKEGKHVASWFD